MACSKYEYVKKFESPISLLPSTFIVIRLDGKGFTKFTDAHEFEKPNDLQGLSLMNRSAEEVLHRFPEIWIAYGQSDEYSFVLKKNTTLFNRRYEKIVSCIVSCFSSAFALNFQTFFPNKKLQEVPIFDGRCVCYPDIKTLRDYLSWRQVDCHINNLYNTCFWGLVLKKGFTHKDAQNLLKDLKSDQKNELLFSELKINYNNIESIFRKGTILIRKEVLKEKHQKKENNEIMTQEQNSKGGPLSTKKVVIHLNEDLINDDFWTKYQLDLQYE